MKANQILSLLCLGMLLAAASCDGSGGDAQSRQSQSTAEVSALDAKQKSIVTIAAFTATGESGELKGALESGLEAGLTVNQIKEVLVQMYAYCGFPRSLTGINTFMAVLEEREKRGIDDETGADPTGLPAGVDKYERGKDVLETLSGESQDGPKTGFAAFSPAIDRYLKEHLFADIFSADIISYAERELATIAALASMKGVEPMLEFHLDAGMNVGLTEAQLEDVMTLVGANIGRERGEAGRKVLARVLESRDEQEKGASDGSDDESEADQQPKADDDSAGGSGDPIFPRGKKVDSNNFTGSIWLHMFVDDAETYDARSGKVTFEPGARTNWHSHPGGQMLLVTSGTGYTQEKGEPRKTHEAGDVVACPPDTLHWHGASPDSEFSHIFIVSNQEKGRTEWAEPVTDEQYAGEGE